MDVVTLRSVLKNIFAFVVCTEFNGNLDAYPFTDFDADFDADIDDQKNLAIRSGQTVNIGCKRSDLCILGRSRVFAP